MTPSPYQAASNHGSPNPSASDHDARRSTMDWHTGETTDEAHAQANRGPTAGSTSPPLTAHHPRLTDGHAAPPGDLASPPPVNEAAAKLALELNLFTEVANQLRNNLVPDKNFKRRCEQAFDIANDLFGNAPTWVCFYRELLASGGMLNLLFVDDGDYAEFQGSDQYQQIQGMLTALRSRDLPENDPNDPQRMITVRLPKSLHEAMCDEATRLNISVNKLCISRMLQMLDPAMIPETTSKPRGRKPRTRSNDTSSARAPAAQTHANQPDDMQQSSGNLPLSSPQHLGSSHPSDNGNPRGFEFTSSIRRP